MSHPRRSWRSRCCRARSRPPASAGGRQGEVGADDDKPASSTTTTTGRRSPRSTPRVAWTDCGDGFQCGTLTVPVDWAAARRASSVGLALIRRPAVVARGAASASLVVNYGGPGESGVDYLRLTLARRLPQAVLDRFDLVSFDPARHRRVAPDRLRRRRAPRLSAGRRRRCPTTAEQLDGPARVQRTCSRRGCADAHRARTRARSGTRNVARDLEAIRIALGEPTLNYLGFSYGTVVGADVRADVPDDDP